MGKLVTWFQGKKTILGGSILILAGVAGAFFGKVSLVDATTLVGFGVSICGIGAKANRYLGALTSVAQAGVDLRLGNKAGALEAITPVVSEAISAAAPALSINVSGSDASAVSKAVTDMTLKSPGTLEVAGK